MTNWNDLTSIQKAELVRPLIETEGLSFSQVATRLGGDVTRLMIAGVVSRSRDRGKPVRTADHVRKHAPKMPPTTKSVFNRFPLKALKARPQAEETPPTDDRPLRERAFLPLDGSTPVPLEQLPATGCKWVTTAESPYLFCALPQHPDSPYCADHHAMAYRPVPPKKSGTGIKVIGISH